MYNKCPSIPLRKNHPLFIGWESIFNELFSHLSVKMTEHPILVIETYQGVYEDMLEEAILKYLKPQYLLYTRDYMHNEEYIREMVYPDLTDDRIFGYLTRLQMGDFMDNDKIHKMHHWLHQQEGGLVVIYGPGASCVAPWYDMLVYADMARWEIQQRMRRHEVDSLGVKNRDTEDWMLLYKQGYFIDWRVCDRLKKSLFDQINYVLDTNDPLFPKMLPNAAIEDAYESAVNSPFSVVPFFDPGPWGGQWMKNICDLDKEVNNFAWCFNCVPEENSLLIDCGSHYFELPSINLVFTKPVELLGAAVYGRFGDEFPIRFDYLDTMDGGNLSLQVHPLTEYIQQSFGMHYTQDESYYLMDAKEGAVVFLGLKEGVDPMQCIHDLRAAQKGTEVFDDTKHIQTWPAKKHDHFLIPGGTIHCSGANSMVLEISATPYIFTFKLWDWQRLGLDGKPRPINIEHGEKVIQWDRTTSWTKENLVNQIEKISKGDGWVEEKTGLHEREFIETRRHWFTKKVSHQTGGGVNVLCLVEGDQIIIESPDNSFKPFIVNYAEVFIVPANISTYTIRPFGPAEGKECATIKAYVRF